MVFRDNFYCKSKEISSLITMTISENIWLSIVTVVHENSKELENWQLYLMQRHEVFRFYIMISVNPMCIVCLVLTTALVYALF